MEVNLSFKKLVNIEFKSHSGRRDSVSRWPMSVRMVTFMNCFSKPEKGGNPWKLEGRGNRRI